MNEIGKRIKEIRNKKGLSQEELAEASKINLRTIQRIENNANEPRGKTLHLICEVLGVNTEDILDYGKQEDTNYLVFFHLSVLVGAIIPTGNIIIPAILWFNKKDKVIGLESIGANLINFQIIWTLITFITLILGVLFKILHISLGPVSGNILLTFPWVILYIINIILPMIFAAKISNGKIKSYYPNVISIIKK